MDWIDAHAPLSIQVNRDGIYLWTADGLMLRGDTLRNALAFYMTRPTTPLSDEKILR